MTWRERRVERAMYLADCAIIDLDPDYARRIRIDVDAIEAKREQDRKANEYAEWMHTRLSA